MSTAAYSPPQSKTALRWESARALSRRLILDAAGTVFAEEGFENATMKRIADVCGVTKVTVYAHYRDKARLYKAVMDGHLTSMPPAELNMQGAVDLGEALTRITDGIGRLAADASCQAYCRSFSRSAYASDVYLKHWCATLQPYLDLAIQALRMASVGAMNATDSEKFVRLVLAEQGLPQGLTPVSDSKATVALFERAYGMQLRDKGSASRVET